MHCSAKTNITTLALSCELKELKKRSTSDWNAMNAVVLMLVADVLAQAKGVMAVTFSM